MPWEYSITKAAMPMNSAKRATTKAALRTLSRLPKIVLNLSIRRDGSHRSLIFSAKDVLPIQSATLSKSLLSRRSVRGLSAAIGL
jgi:hypothetical protein